MSGNVRRMDDWADVITEARTLTGAHERLLWENLEEGNDETGALPGKTRVLGMFWTPIHQLN